MRLEEKSDFADKTQTSPKLHGDTSGVAKSPHSSAGIPNRANTRRALIDRLQVALRGDTAHDCNTSSLSLSWLYENLRSILEGRRHPDDCGDDIGDYEAGGDDDDSDVSDGGDDDDSDVGDGGDDDDDGDGDDDGGDVDCGDDADDKNTIYGDHIHSIDNDNDGYDADVIAVADDSENGGGDNFDDDHGVVAASIDSSNCDGVKLCS